MVLFWHWLPSTVVTWLFEDLNEIKPCEGLRYIVWRDFGTEGDFSLLLSFLLSRARVAKWFTVLCCMRHARSWVQIHTNGCEHMICKYMDQKDLAAMQTSIQSPLQTSIQSVSVIPEVNLRITTGEKAHKQGIHPGFVIQSKCHQKSKTGVSVAP